MHHLLWTLLLLLVPPVWGQERLGPHFDRFDLLGSDWERSAGPHGAAPPEPRHSPAEPAEDWELPDDDLEERIGRVSSGALRFLPQPPARPVHQHRNEIRISGESLQRGWVALSQCHSNLDPVPAAEIVFRPERTRGLRILSHRNIGTARIEGASVQLQDIGPDAELCVELESRALTRLSDDGWSLRNGPYMRRFLDGYYPMRVYIRIRYPADLLQVGDFSPQPQPGLTVRRIPGEIELESWHEGRLNTRFDFCRRGAPACPRAE